MDEFGLIRRFFTRAPRSPQVVVGVGDDGAVLEPAAGLRQVQVIDTLVEGVHFLSNMGAADLGFRVVAVNLSDIAAMGARPRWMTLALTLPDKDESWVEAFASGLFEAADQYGVDLVGGDITEGDVVVASVHMTGEVEEGKALLRSGAQPGDTIYVTGTGFVAPDMIGLLLSTEVIIWVAVGGRGTLIGPFIGTYLVWSLQMKISSIDTKLWPLFLGVFFIGMVFLFPNGILTIFSRLKSLFFRLKGTT